MLTKNQKRPQTFSFLELPAEIRNTVYHHALDLDEPIELWPETGDVYADQKRCRRNAVILKRKLCTKRAHNLGLLRTCNQINAEVAVVFYGQNEFRFSGVNGNIATYAFITKIGRRNLKLLKSITMAMPLWIPERGHYDENWNPTTWRLIDEVYDRMPSPYIWTKGWCRRRFPRLGFRES